MSVDQWRESVEVEQAATWRRAVEAAVDYLADDYEIDPDELLATEAFIARLDGTVGLDPDTDAEAFAEVVEAAVAAHTGKAPARAKEAVTLVSEHGPELVFPSRGDYIDERTTEATDHIEGHVTESLGTDAAGGRVFRVRIIREGTSRNRKRYTESVLRRAAPLYNGAKCYDHHRSPAEMQTSTVVGLVGGYRNVTYEGDGLYGDLHLFPSAKHTAEALDAAISAQAAGLPPLVGISHDVHASFKAGVPSSGGHVQEAVAITQVNSADVVADPSAGGQATRVLAGGIESDTEESDVTVTTEAVLAALQTAGDAELAAAGLARVDTNRTTEAAGEPKGSFIAGIMISHKLAAAGLPESVRESVTAGLPERVTEADVDKAVGSYKDVLAGLERGGLAPTVTATVVRESRDNVVDGLNKAFDGDYTTFRSIKQAWEAFTGQRATTWGEDENRTILRESIGSHYDSGTRRATESLTSSSWAEVLGDSITRKMIAMYESPDLRNWQAIVSDIVPVNDFRTQRRTRVGGYGTLPVVAQGQPYPSLTSPGDEEATYALEKKGGVEDLTMEMIANDDLGALARIPRLLGLAAARTLHNFVWDFLATNPTIYDAVALFHASHANTTAVALSQSNVSSLRQKMRDQTGYGDTSNILSLVPKYLIVPNELEELAFQICESAVAIPATPAGPSDTPNLHRGLTPIVVDYLSDANDWFLTGNPQQVPTIELGFYQGRQQPELFTQSSETVGSMWNADVLSYKIRHIYKGAVVEYRGMQRGTQ